MWYKEAGKGDRSRKMRQRDRQRKYKARMKRRQGGATAAPAAAPSAAPATRTSAPASRGGGGSAISLREGQRRPRRDLIRVSHNKKGFKVRIPVSRISRIARPVGLAALGAGTVAAGLHMRNKRKRQQKTASIAEYSVLFDKVASGDLGEHSRQALYGICQSLDAPIAAEKTASVYNAGDLSENDARKARLDQLLKR